MSQPQSTKIDLMYIEGDTDIVGSLQRWVQNKTVESETSITFSSQVFEFCDRHNFNTLAVSHSSKLASWVSGNFLAENSPKTFMSGGIGYHFSQFLYGIKILAKTLVARPRYLHITSGLTHLVLLTPLKWAGIKTVLHFHNGFWSKGSEPPRGLIKQWVLKSEGWYLGRVAHAAVCVSPEIKQQIAQISHQHNPNIYLFKPQFNRKDFAAVLPAPIQQTPFVLTYAGRIELDKGLMDLLDMAQALKNEDVLFNVCGEGTLKSQFEQEIIARGLQNKVLVHGRLNRPQLLDIYAQSHAVIVPTRSEFNEGLNMVAVEAILCNRPVITSNAIPAIDLIRPAVVEATVNDPASYVQAIRTLMQDSAYYNTLCLACKPLQEQFFDRKESLSRVLEKTL